MQAFSRVKEVEVPKLPASLKAISLALVVKILSPMSLVACNPSHVTNLPPEAVQRL